MEPRNPRPRTRAGVLAAALACAALAACFFLPFLRYLPKDELTRTTTWSLALLFSFAGWGTMVQRLFWPGREVSLSLRAMWGASVLALFGGTLAAMSLLSRGALIAFVGAGLIVVANACVAARDELARRALVRLRATRLHPGLFAVVLFVAAGVAIHYLGGASDTTSNPYDDDIAYYPFARQLLDRGTLIDPFSFRRMSTLGGQALFHATLLVRVGVQHLNVFDRSMCILLSAGMVISHRTEGRKAPLLARVVAIVFLVLLPNTSINSASYYSGLAFFLGLYQTLELLPNDLATKPRATLQRVLPLALIGAAACTLRQNYQAAVGVVLVVAYAAAIKRSSLRPWRQRLIEPAFALGLVALFVLPWLVLLYRSNDTFLFPLLKGTFRAGVAVESQVMTVSKLLRLFVDVFLTPDPIRTLPLFMLVGFFVRERALRRPLASQWISALVSIALLCAAFSLADAGNLARYDYGFVTASVLLTWLTVAARLRRTRASFAEVAPGAILVFALLAALDGNTHRTKKMIDDRLRDTAEMLRRTVPAQLEPPIAGSYRRLQQAVPGGERILVMVDEPFWFDYRRNEVWNLDMPGSSSPRPGIPCFRGPEPVADYLQAQGIRYVTFVEPARSTFMYRRDIWFDHLYDPDEIWRIYAPYITDVIDNLVALSATRKHLHEEAGMVVLDLGDKTAPTVP